MSAHTPGHWRVEDGELIGDSTILAMLCWHSGRDAENQADYALIAAAPDLLAALETLVSQRDAHFHTTQAWDAARAVIAKAKAR